MIELIGRVQTERLGPEYLNILHPKGNNLFSRCIASLYGLGSEVAIVIMAKQKEGPVWVFDSWQSGTLDFNFCQELTQWQQSLGVQEVVVNPTATEEGEAANPSISKLLNRRLPLLKASVAETLEPYLGLVTLAELKVDDQLNAEYYEQRDRLEQALRKLADSELSALSMAFLQGVVRLGKPTPVFEYKAANAQSPKHLAGFI